MKTRKGTSYLPLIRYNKLTSAVQEAVLYLRANVQTEEHSEAETSNTLVPTLITQYKFVFYTTQTNSADYLKTAARTAWNLPHSCIQRIYSAATEL